MAFVVSPRGRSVHNPYATPLDISPLFVVYVTCSAHGYLKKMQKIEWQTKNAD